MNNLIYYYIKQRDLIGFSNKNWRQTVDAPSWRVSELRMYPLKSARGIPLKQATIDVHGMKDDRRFMVVDAETGMFVAQRGESGQGIGIKSMCQITPVSLETQTGRCSWALDAPGMSRLHIPPFGALNRRVRIWKTELEAATANEDVNQWFNDFLGRERNGRYQLVTVLDDVIRRPKLGYSQLRFADGYPFLVISQESLDDLNKRIGGNPLPMNRFRPNIVIKGGQPYDEDRLDRMVINGVELEGMELCVRCPITTTDQDTAEQGKEPLRTLATYRRNPAVGGNGVIFGRNFNHLSQGKISVGDHVKPLHHQEYDAFDPY